MWMYAISIFLIALTPGSFLFTAIYGLAVSLAVVAFGTLVGDWIDVTSRLRGTGQHKLLSSTLPCVYSVSFHVRHIMTDCLMHA